MYIWKSAISLYQQQSIWKGNQDGNPICDSIKKNKIVKNNLTKMRDLYTEKYKTLKEEIRVDKIKKNSMFMVWKNS